MTLPVEQTWFVLVELLTDLRKRDVEVPVSVTEDIRLVRTSINFYKTDTENPEMIKELKRINDMLNSIQEELLDLAENLDPDYPGEWIEKLKRARAERKSINHPKQNPGSLWVLHQDLQQQEYILRNPLQKTGFRTSPKPTA